MLSGATIKQAGAADRKDKSDQAPSSKDDTFEPGRLHTVQIALSEKEFAAITPVAASRGGFFGFGRKPEPKEPAEVAREMHRNMFGMNLPWATGSVSIDGQTIDNVGVRYKGNGTIGDAARTVKKSFKIDLDHFGGTGRFHGRKTLNLHCGVADPSKCREALGYRLYRASGVPAPRTAFAEVWLDVPGKYDNSLLGLYIIVEQPDKQFLQAHFGSDKGLLMKPEGLRDFVDMGDDWKKYTTQLKPKRDATDEEAARMIAFARLASKADDEEFRREIDSYLEIDGYLRYLATTAFISNSDSFFALGHNYYAYLHPATGKLHFFPWDLDRSFANLPIFGSKQKQMDFSMTHPYSGSHRLTERLLEMPGMSERYQNLLKELAATVFARESVLRDVESLEAEIKAPFERDAQAAKVRKDGIAGFGPFVMLGQPPDLRTFVDRRTKSVAAQLAGTSQGHIPTGGFGPGAFKLVDFLSGPMLEDLDADRNERLSRAEWLAAPQRLFEASDKDDEGQVNLKGLTKGVNTLFPRPTEGEGGQPGPQGAFSAGGYMAAPIFKRADADKDGKVTLSELVAAAEALFDLADKQKMGELDEPAFYNLLTALFPPSNFGQPLRRPAGDKDAAEKKAD
ncbi:MAG: CotH kinase family protein [Planctomycetia bacterium]|nr:CotH kinase family protein [Planctomycetia bacterium]